jgi:outer membrane protein
MVWLHGVCPRSARLRDGINRFGAYFWRRRYGLVLLAFAPVHAQTGAGLSLLEAVRATLSNNPSLRAQQAQIEIAIGLKDQASGIFDPLLQGGLTHAFSMFAPTLTTPQGELLPSPTITEDSNLTTFSFSSSKLFRDGISVTPSVQMQRTDDSFIAPEGINNGTAGVTVTIPLLQGRGRSVVAAQETAARQEIEASRLDLDFLLSQLASNAANDYWSLVAAVRNLGVAASAEERGKVYVETTQALIDADHVPRNDINEVKANLAQRTAARIAAQQTVWQARQQLALDMGLAPAEILTDMADPSDDFPAIPAELAPRDDAAAMKSYLDQALKQRADYLAAQNRRGQSEILEVAARNRLLPVLNLQMGAGYSAIRPGTAFGDYLIGPFSNVRGPNITGGLTYTFPVGNHAARGVLEQDVAAVRQGDVRITQTAQGISQQIVVAVKGVRNAILRVRESRSEVDSSQQSVDGAREKYRAGLGSVVEILQVEDQLNTALGDQVQAQLAYAQALVQLRFATATLVPAHQATPTITPDVLFTLPFGNMDLQTGGKDSNR